MVVLLEGGGVLLGAFAALRCACFALPLRASILAGFLACVALPCGGLVVVGGRRLVVALHSFIICYDLQAVGRSAWLSS